MASTIQVRVEDDLKAKADELFRETVNPYVALTEDNILVTLERSRAHAAQGMCREAEDVVRDMRAKYGL